MTDQSQDKITLEDFKKTCTELFAQRTKVDEMTALLKVEADKLDDLKSKVLVCLEQHEMEKYHVEGFGLIFTSERFTVPTPKSVEAKKEFGKYLQKKGIFWELMSVNSQTLNSFYKTEMEAAIAKGDVDFKVPGIGEPSHMRVLNVRKG
jgi:hypothetical protein